MKQYNLICFVISKIERNPGDVLVQSRKCGNLLHIFRGKRRIVAGPPTTRRRIFT